MKINDLLNPAKLLRDENIYDSDGIIINASTSKDLSASETHLFTLQDITENIVDSDLAVCENIHLGKQEAGNMSVVTVVEGHIPAASQESKDHELAVSQESIASMSTSVVTVVEDHKPVASQESRHHEPAVSFTPKNIFKHMKRPKNSSKSTCSAKSNNYVESNPKRKIKKCHSRKGDFRNKKGERVDLNFILLKISCDIIAINFLN